MGEIKSAKKKRIIEQAGGICYICDQPGADTVDHVIPRSRGGTDAHVNLRAAHHLCNFAKADAYPVCYAAKSDASYLPLADDVACMLSCGRAWRIVRYAVRNDGGAECSLCGEVHPFYTVDEKVLLISHPIHENEGETVPETDPEVMRAISKSGSEFRST